MTRLLVVVIALLALACSAPNASANVGPYLDFAERPDFVEGPTVRIGSEGVPQVRYSWGWADHPVTVATWALTRWSHGHRRAAITASDWFIRRQRFDGAWEYLFDFNVNGLGMRAPWISAMSQGMAISVLVRAHAATGRRRYLRVALRALDPFTRGYRNGGVASHLDGARWYEEYPRAVPWHVLNGFQYALLGLHDLSDRSRRARKLWRAGVAGLAAKIHLFDRPAERTTLYGLLGAARAPVAGSGYQREHTVLTRTIARLTGNRTLRRYAARWASYQE